MTAQTLGQITVQLNHRQMTQTLHQRLGQCCQTRTNLHHALTRAWINRTDNGINDAAVDQEVLAKTFTGNVLHWGGSRNSTKALLRISCAHAVNAAS